MKIVTRDDDEPHTFWVFDRPVVWSFYWGFAAVIVVAAIILLLLPISDDAERRSGPTLRCGSAVSSFEDAVIEDDDGDTKPASGYAQDECEELHEARWTRSLAVLATAVLPIWLGRRHVSGAEVHPAHVGACVCVGVSLLLLLGPHTSSKDAECGSPLWMSVEDTGEDDDVVSESCLAERPSRVAWAVLWGVAAVPFALAAGSRRKDDDD